MALCTDYSSLVVLLLRRKLPFSKWDDLYDEIYPGWRQTYTKRKITSLKNWRWFTGERVIEKIKEKEMGDWFIVPASDCH